MAGGVMVTGNVGLRNNLPQCRRQSIRSSGDKSKVRGEQSFLLTLALEKHAVHNAIT